MWKRYVNSLPMVSCGSDLYWSWAALNAFLWLPPDSKPSVMSLASLLRDAANRVSNKPALYLMAKRLAAYKIPEEVIFLEDLPKNAPGKVNRRALWGRHAAADRLVEQT